MSSTLVYNRVPMCFYIHRRSVQSPFTCVRPSALRHFDIIQTYTICLIDTQHGQWWALLADDCHGYAFTNIDNLGKAIVYFSQFPRIRFTSALDKQHNYKECLALSKIVTI